MASNRHRHHHLIVNRLVLLILSPYITINVATLIIKHTICDMSWKLLQKHSFTLIYILISIYWMGQTFTLDGLYDGLKLYSWPRALDASLGGYSPCLSLITVVKFLKPIPHVKYLLRKPKFLLNTKCPY